MVAKPGNTMEDDEDIVMVKCRRCYIEFGVDPKCPSDTYVSLWTKRSGFKIYGPYCRICKDKLGPRADEEALEE